MNILVINMIVGRLDRLEALIAQVRTEPISAVFVLGNVVAPSSQSRLGAKDITSEQTYRTALELLGSRGVPIYLIPGEHDPALVTINRLVQDYRGPARIHLVHRTAAASGETDVVAGFGGRLTHDHEATDGTIHFPAWEARIAFEHLHGYNDLFRRAQRRIVLLGMAPQGTHIDRENGVSQGVALLNSLIRAYQPDLVCCGGPRNGRGVETISGSRVVNPGWLSDGSFALVDTHTLSTRLGCLVEPLKVDNNFRSIVVALDGSPEAWRAFELAAGLAKNNAAKLTLVYAWEPVGASRGQPYVDDNTATRMAAGERLLAEARSYVPHLVVEQEVLEGPAATAIIRVAQARRADLIVLGARGLGALRSAIGSVSQRVLHDAHCPVLIAREAPRNQSLLDRDRASQLQLH